MTIRVRRQAGRRFRRSAGSSIRIGSAQDADMPGGKVTQVYADGRYWVQDATGSRGTAARGGAARSRRLSSATSSACCVKRAAGRSSSAKSTATRRPRLGAIEVSGGGMSRADALIDRDNGLIDRRRVPDAPDGDGRGRGIQRLPHRQRHQDRVSHGRQARRAAAADRARYQGHPFQPAGAAGHRSPSRAEASDGRAHCGS